MSYNGFKNWSTWNFNLHFDGYFEDLAEEIKDRYLTKENPPEKTIIIDDYLSDMKDFFIRELSKYIKHEINSIEEKSMKDIKSIGLDPVFFDIAFDLNGWNEIDSEEIAELYWDDLEKRIKIEIDEILFGDDEN